MSSLPPTQTRSDVVFQSDAKQSVSEDMMLLTVAPPPTSPSAVLLEQQDERTEMIGRNSCPFENNEEPCDLCQMIRDTSKTDWAFQWIQKLRDWEKALQYEGKCHQLTFNIRSGGMMDPGSRVRDKLGILQTEMVKYFNSPCLHFRTSPLPRNKVTLNFLALISAACLDNSR
jgi:hypothetical protein